MSPLGVFLVAALVGLLGYFFGYLCGGRDERARRSRVLCRRVERGYDGPEHVRIIGSQQRFPLPDPE